MTKTAYVGMVADMLHAGQIIQRHQQGKRTRGSATRRRADGRRRRQLQAATLPAIRATQERNREHRRHQESCPPQETLSYRKNLIELRLGRMVPATCFCQYCRAKAEDRGISSNRARAGYRELEELFRAAAADQPNADGYFVTFWRILLRYPEILSWETLWTDSYQGLEAQLYGEAKALAPEKPFGFHIMQSFTFSPFYRAEEDYTKRRNFADFLKPATYNNAGGPRMAAYLNRLSKTIFHDARPEDFIDFYYKIMQDPQAPYDQLATSGLSADYVARETKRAVEEVAGMVKIYPGIDIDVPTLTNAKIPEKRTAPDDVHKSIRAAFGAGADGVVLSREYAEMWLANLAAAGDTLREVFAEKPRA